MVAPVNQIIAPRTTDGGNPSAAAALSNRELRALQAAGGKLDTHDPQTVQHAAGELLSELFFKPLLAEMRRFPFGRELATGGQTEAVFGEQLDQRIADSVAAADPGLLKQITRRLERKSVRPAGADRTNWSIQVPVQEAARKGAS